MTHPIARSIPKAAPNRTGDTDAHVAANESTPLLLDGDEEAPNTRQIQTPLPKVQLGAVIAVRIVDPIAYQQIFPYINQLLVDLRIAEPERVGFYSGLVVRMDFPHDRPFLLTSSYRWIDRRAPTRSRRCFRCTSGERYQVSERTKVRHRHMS